MPSARGLASHQSTLSIGKGCCQRRSHGHPPNEMIRILMSISASITLGCSGALLATFLALTSLAAQASPSAGCDSIQYRLVDPASETKLARFQNHRTGERLALEDSVFLTAKDMERIYSEPMRIGSDTAWSVIATLKPDAARRFRSITAGHVGDRIAVRIADDIVDTGRIESALGAKVPIVINVPKVVADSLLARVTRLTSASCLNPAR